ncbi:hypothetical protein [Nocardia sp. NPDC051832]|uniref:hypothetical protein n=1 Tax=Nocardia sp. NPDC051832 TaxID=3155673 RepID=UPI003418162C
MKSLGMTIAAMAAVVGLVGCGGESGTAGSASGTKGVASPAEPSAPAPERSPTAAPATTPLPTRNDATVDARDYQIGDKFYFQSPSGNIMCGFINDDNFGTGCQLKDAKVIPAQLQPRCDNSPARKVGAHLQGSSATFICLSQGIFVGFPEYPGSDGGSREGGGKVLNYGDTLIVRGTACTSFTTGVRCDQGGHGFFLAADQQSLF